MLMLPKPNREISLNEDYEFEIRSESREDVEKFIKNYFKVECEMAVSKDQAKKLRYGLEGKFVMVTGENTYFSYYMEKFFNLG